MGMGYHWLYCFHRDGFIYNHFMERITGKGSCSFNGAGEVDRWGSRFELWILPLVSLFTLLFLQIFERHPEIHNHPKRMNESNRAQFYLLSRRLINQVKNICLIIFAFITLESV